MASAKKKNDGAASEPSKELEAGVVVPTAPAEMPANAPGDEPAAVDASVSGTQPPEIEMPSAAAGGELVDAPADGVEKTPIEMTTDADGIAHGELIDDGVVTPAESPVVLPPPLADGEERELVDVPMSVDNDGSQHGSADIEDGVVTIPSPFAESPKPKRAPPTPVGLVRYKVWAHGMLSMDGTDYAPGSTLNLHPEHAASLVANGVLSAVERDGPVECAQCGPGTGAKVPCSVECFVRAGYPAEDFKDFVARRS